MRFDHAINVLAAVLLGTAALAPSENAATVADRAPRPAEGAAGSVLLTCEVFRVDDEELTGKIEAATTSASNDAAPIAALLEGAGGVARLARIHAPVQIDHEMRYSNSRQVPTVSVSQGQSSDQVSFAGYQKAETQLNFRSTQDGTGFTTWFSIQIETFSSDEATRAAPPPRDRVSVSGNVSAPTGVVRMYQLDADSNLGGSLIVFITATAL